MTKRNAADVQTQGGRLKLAPAMSTRPLTPRSLEELGRHSIGLTQGLLRKKRSDYLPPPSPTAPGVGRDAWESTCQSAKPPPSTPAQ